MPKTKEIKANGYNFKTGDIVRLKAVTFMKDGEEKSTGIGSDQVGLLFELRFETDIDILMLSLEDGRERPMSWGLTTDWRLDLLIELATPETPLKPEFKDGDRVVLVSRGENPFGVPKTAEGKIFIYENAPKNPDVYGVTLVGGGGDMNRWWFRIGYPPVLRLATAADEIPSVVLMRFFYKDGAVLVLNSDGSMQCTCEFAAKEKATMDGEKWVAARACNHVRIVVLGKVQESGRVERTEVNADAMVAAQPPVTNINHNERTFNFE